jgi:hypothetical protein
MYCYRENGGQKLQDFPEVSREFVIMLEVPYAE